MAAVILAVTAPVRWCPAAPGAAQAVATSQPAVVEIEPKPAAPAIADLAPPADFQPPAGLPVVAFADNVVPTRWLHVCPAPKGMGAQLAAALLKPPADAEAGKLLAQLKPLPPEMIAKDCWPDFTDAINLRKLGGEKPGQRSCLAAAIQVDGPRLVRVCHGAAGMNTTASLWIAGQEVAHGQLVRLAKGVYPVVIEAFHGQRGTWIAWSIAWLAPRLTVVAEQEVDDVHRWRTSLWEESVAAARADGNELMARIRIDPATVAGKAGFFRVGRSVNGKWWLIDPSDKPFYHMGCTGLNAGGMGGRRMRMPPVAAETAARWVGLLRDWDFNAMGSWTTPEFFDKNMPYADIIDGGYLAEGSLARRFPDVFDEAWRRAYDERCKAICPPNRDNRMCIGYYLENETGFMEMLGPGQRIVANSPAYRPGGPLPEDRLLLPAEPQLNTRGLGLLQYCLSLQEDRAAYKKAWEFVLARHDGKAEAVGKAWGVALTTRQDIRKLTANEIVLCSDAYVKDHWDFVRLWLEEYFAICVKAIRKYDPNHMILGMRWGGTPHPNVLAVEAKWVDIASRNCYHAEFNDTYTEFHRYSGRPVLNGEYSLTTDSYLIVRDPIEPPGGYTPAQRQAVRIRQAMDRAFAHPGIVGLTKYRWHGGGDGLWSGKGPQMRSVEIVRPGNVRSAYVAANADRPPIARHDKPVHGQVFLTLSAAVVNETKLPPAQPDGKGSLRLGSSPMRIGLVCREGKWDAQVYGNGIRGEVRAAEGDNDKARLTVRIRLVPTLLTREAGTGEYAIEMTRDGDRFAGTMKGKWEDRDTAGFVQGYLHRPATTVKY
jgi:hypothetical protein